MTNLYQCYEYRFSAYFGLSIENGMSQYQFILVYCFGITAYIYIYNFISYYLQIYIYIISYPITYKKNSKKFIIFNTFIKLVILELI